MSKYRDDMIAWVAEQTGTPIDNVKAVLETMERGGTYMLVPLGQLFGLRSVVRTDDGTTDAILSARNVDPEALAELRQALDRVS
jgi:hypothetical protein